MRLLVLFFISLTNLLFATNKKSDGKELQALTGLHKFEVITLFTSQENIDKELTYNSFTESFKKAGQTTISESDSMFKTLLQNGVNYPICFLTITEQDEQLTVSMDVLVEVEVLANKYKTTSAI